MLWIENIFLITKPDLKRGNYVYNFVRRLLIFLRGYFSKIKAPDLIAGGANSLQVLLYLRFIPKLSQGPESPGTCAYSEVKETAVTGNCSEAAVL